ncbi:MAG: hypothetical protein IKF35_10930 [Solobacterium sp.]|nr:hypothetical protein [Solobacterium sp.]
MKQKTWLRLRHALQEILEEYPADEVTVDILTRQAGLTRQGFYYYYHSLPEYVGGLLRQELQDLPAVRDSAAELLICLLNKEAELQGILKKLYGSSFEPETDCIIRDCLHRAVQHPDGPQIRRTCLEYILYGLLKDRIGEKNTDPAETVYLQYAGAVSTLLRML